MTTPIRPANPAASSDAPGKSGSSTTLRATRAEQLQQTIKDLIVERKLGPGDPLPTELTLIDELGVGRNSLREALKALQAVGIIEIRHGFGMYVGHMSLDAMVSELTFYGRIRAHPSYRSLANVIDIREILETGLVRRLTTAHVDGNSSEVADVLDEMEREAAVGAVSPETDRAFHQALYVPLGNPLVAQLLGALWDVYFQLRDQLEPRSESAADLVRRHRDIYDAVCASDTPAAVDAMVTHFDGVRNRLREQASADPVA